jgi:simple sugar transport system permease protein
MATATAVQPDERLTRTGLIRRTLVRPELGASIGAVAVFVFFAFYTDDFARPSSISTWLDTAALLGIMAVVVAVLMIGGEFDLSAGVMTGSSALIIGLFAARLGVNLWYGVLVAIVFGALVGLANGLLVVRTGLPSFIITLGMFLVLQGLNLGGTLLLTKTVRVSDVDREPLAGGNRAGYDSAYAVFAKQFHILGGDFRITTLWWAAITVLATWVLLRTRAGNWVFAVGGNATAARSVGVPAGRTKVAMFMAVSVTAALVGAMYVTRLKFAVSQQGIGLEFQYIIAAVIGGCLLTGGYGSAIGASIGALIFGMASLGIIYAGWSSDWFQLFLGILLLGATILNHYVRRRAEAAR